LGWVHKHAEAPVPDIRSFNARLPEGLTVVIERLLAKAPRDRYGTVGEVHEDFKRAAAGLAVAGRAPRSSDAETRILAPDLPPMRENSPENQLVNTSPPPPRRSSFWTGVLTLALMAGAAFIMLVLGVLGLSLWRNSNGGGPATGAVPTPEPSVTSVVAAPASPTSPLTSASPSAPTLTAPASTPTSTENGNPEATAQAEAAINNLPAPVRSREALIVPFSSAIPDVNGELSDWAPETFTMIPYVRFQPQNVADERDLSAACASRWTEDILFLACRVRDDILVQEASGNLLYEGDSLELYFDTEVMRDRESAEMDRDDVQIGILPGAAFDRAPEVYLWFPRDEERFLSEVGVSSRTTSEGYDVEIAVPWQTLDFRPKSSDFLGFSLNLNDNDTPGTTAQESQLSLISTHQWANPTTWGLLLLAGGS
jgi:hypothetical protein